MEIDHSDPSFFSNIFIIMAKEKLYNRHHLLWVSNREQYNVHTPENIILMERHRHDALHALYGVLNTPKEQMKEARCLYDTILSDTAKQLFDQLLSLSDSDFYISSVLKKWRK